MTPVPCAKVDGMTQIVVSMVVIVLVAGVVAAYVAFPHRGEDLPGAPVAGAADAQGRPVAADRRARAW